VKSFINNSFWKFDVEDNAYVILKNRLGQNAFFHSSATMWNHTFKIEITLEEGYIIVDGLLSKTGSYGREKLVIGKRQFEDEASAIGNPEEEVTYFDRDLSWNLEVEEFVKCIDQDKKVTISSSVDALKVMEIIEKAYRNAREE
jgi:predicted dehydrogenase